VDRDSKSKTYHHGDLRRAILDAGEAELSESGLAGFSLRRVAARVGVSHTAPSHHFGDSAGLIEALAARGFRRLLDCMEARQAGAPDTPYERLIASGHGYLDFALGSPALFRLVFAMTRKTEAGPELQAAGDAAFQHLARGVAALNAGAPLGEADARAAVLACWTRVHGMAELILAGYIDLAQGPAGQSEREELFRRMFEVDFNRPLS
jgi:AcrR family transcriptional regulator